MNRDFGSAGVLLTDKEAGTLLTIGIYGDNLSEKREKGGWLCQAGRGKNGGKSVQQLIYQSDEEKKRPKEKR